VVYFFSSRQQMSFGQRKGLVRQEAFLLTSGYSHVVCFFNGVREIAALSLGYFWRPKSD
jgi:hypothetical protein